MNKQTKTTKQNKTKQKTVYKLRNMKVTVIMEIVGALGTISKSLEKKMGNLKIFGRIGAVHTMVLLQSTKLLKKMRNL